MKEMCTYPKCRCPFDAPPGWCAKGLPVPETSFIEHDAFQFFAGLLCAVAMGVSFYALAFLAFWGH